MQTADKSAQNVELTEEAAEAARRTAVQARVEGCQRELETVLQKHRCSLQCVLVLIGGQLPQAEVRIVPL